MAAAKKTKDDIKLSDELGRVVDGLVSASAKSGGSVSEDDIQVAIRDVDVDGDELSDLYDTLRAKGVEITTSGEAANPAFGIGSIDAGDDDDDFGSDDDFSDDDDSLDGEDDEESEAANEAKEIIASLRAHYGKKIRVFGTEIPFSVQAAETSGRGKSIFAHDKNGKVAAAYRSLTKEVLEFERKTERFRDDAAR